MQTNPVELVGERAKLVPMNSSHVEALFAAGRYPEIWTYMFNQVADVEDIEHLVSSALSARDTGDEFPFVIIDQATNQVVGSTRFLDISSQHRQLEIGSTWLTPSVWRTRMNTECKYLLLKHCFEVLETIRVQIKTDRRNVQSQRAIERLGAVKEGVLRRHRILPDGYVRDTVYYSVIDEEWPAVKARLEAFLG
ncbi:GNAT family N-acetyltransferase [Alicyclobacillus acidoterrestris]|uniref:GNAT family N-acetyltransferase n=1 Tax=Alicyclobacillus acidoterrestris (strain ATCC 49025 / DSM 3922 / CIP 106132 / NCIMB 13137 / GD3B) TaxID=1356854 RepID=T0CNH1_ALIAG|nr:GNAT family protein [Alicyclobacillus acidoterrestris]EPZ41012.1 hypothetical protein N007_17455 [Alicyclobacillus acidoterrestris ATCC 49025]UNO47824.1 GNAT family N-acetyltransferase [Alicyclobacillus acidoterrestris]GEO27172.1 N-acetyltransferase [Alicyclobacillus acidoterrestris]